MIPTSVKRAEPVNSGLLGGASERFALGRPRFGQVLSSDRPSTEGARPFGLRFVVEPEPATVELPPWRYCPDRQIAVTPDGEAWHEVVDMTMRTTGYSTDGGGSTGNEEYRPDYVADEPGQI